MRFRESSAAISETFLRMLGEVSCVMAAKSSVFMTICISIVRPGKTSSNDEDRSRRSNTAAICRTWRTKRRALSHMAKVPGFWGPCIFTWRSKNNVRRKHPLPAPISANLKISSKESNSCSRSQKTRLKYHNFLTSFRVEGIPETLSGQHHLQISAVLIQTSSAAETSLTACNRNVIFVPPGIVS